MSLVTVLTPNGRRQNVKVTPNTTLLQVLEEVCQKHGFKPENYDIKHHNKVLDVSSIFRFSGLPNNAQLELAEATKQRSESPVVLGLHLESGDRLTGEFIPSDCLWDVINKLKPDEVNAALNPVIIYMRKEIIGRENLEKTTLRSLGLTGGRAMLRFLNKTPEQLRTQANVSSVLSRSVPSPIESKEITAPSHTKNESSHKSLPTPSEQIFKEVEKGKHIREDKHRSQDKPPEGREPIKKEKADSDVEGSPTPSKKVSSKIHQEKGSKLSTLPEAKHPVPVQKDVSPKKENVHAKHAVQKPSKGKEEKKETPKPILLGERNAIAYDLNAVKPADFEDVPDDFFELTISDAKLLLRDAQKFTAELEEAPLMTSAQREFEENKKMLSLLHDHKKTVLRIKFPDRTVLQGTFAPVETIASVEKFVSQYLEDPKLPFYLYTTPPKVILKSESRLLETNCVPSAVLYFGLHPETSPPEQYLKSAVLKQFSSPSAAAIAANESRGLSSHKANEERKDKHFKSEASSASSSEAGPSRAPSYRTSDSAGQTKSPPNKVPKWFKPTNK